MKVLGLALYGNLAASTRYRLGQYVPSLAAAGIDLEIRSLLGDDYLRRRFAGERIGPGILVKSAARRLKDLLQQRRYSAAVVYCELMPLMPGPLESALLRIPYVYDFDDAFYLRYGAGKLAPYLGGKFDRMMRNAAQVTAGSRVLADYASRHNQRTHHLPTVVDTNRYQPARRPQGGPFTVGWVGSPSTTEHLSELVEPLSRIGREGPVRLVVIGGQAPAVPDVEVIELRWSEADEVRLINSFDVGVMPLIDHPWARGKCAFKLIQYMACGVPGIASPVGANKDVLTPECGILAASASEWVEAFRKLRDQPALRQAMGEASRARVESHYSLHQTAPRLEWVIRQAGSRAANAESRA
jgi:glycosyltransferase involved in cell wall biosynthesis